MSTRGSSTLLIAALLSVALAAGCGGTNTDTDTDEVGGNSATTSTPDAFSTYAAAPEVENLYTFTYTDSGGVETAGRMVLANPMPANSPDLVRQWRYLARNAPTSAACVSNPTRDGVVVGNLSFNVDSDEYLPSNLAITFVNATNLSTFLFEVDTSDGGCQTDGFNTVTPVFDGNDQWGPVPIAFTIPDMYGPGGVNLNAYTQFQSAMSIRGDSLTPGENSRTNMYGLDFTVPTVDGTPVEDVDSAAAAATATPTSSAYDAVLGVWEEIGYVTAAPKYSLTLSLDDAGELEGTYEEYGGCDGPISEVVLNGDMLSFETGFLSGTTCRNRTIRYQLVGDTLVDQAKKRDMTRQQ